MRNMRGALAAAMAGAFLVAGCGGDDVAESDEGSAVGASSAAELLSDYYEAMEHNDLQVMFSLLDPEIRSGISRADWSGCMSERLSDISGIDLEYEHGDTYEESGGTFAEGVVVLSKDGQEVEQPLVVEVVQRDGRWFAVRSVSSTQPDCIEVVRNS